MRQYPGNMDEVRAIVRAVAPKPVNLVVGTMAGTLRWADAQATGVKRLSLGAALYLRVMGDLAESAKELRGGSLDHRFRRSALEFDGPFFRRTSSGDEQGYRCLVVTATSFSHSTGRFMMITKHQVGVSKHIGNYRDAAVVGPNARWLCTSGTPGIECIQQGVRKHCRSSRTGLAEYLRGSQGWRNEIGGPGQDHLLHYAPRGRG